MALAQVVFDVMRRRIETILSTGGAFQNRHFVVIIAVRIVRRVRRPGIPGHAGVVVCLRSGTAEMFPGARMGLDLQSRLGGCRYRPRNEQVGKDQR